VQQDRLLTLEGSPRGLYLATVERRFRYGHRFHFHQGFSRGRRSLFRGFLLELCDQNIEDKDGTCSATSSQPSLTRLVR